jgi:hypothetical protein
MEGVTLPKVGNNPERLATLCHIPVVIMAPGSHTGELLPRAEALGIRVGMLEAALVRFQSPRTATSLQTDSSY